MNNRSIIYRVFKVAALLFLVTLKSIVIPEEIKAQVPAPFLNTPYYGSFIISQGYHLNHRAYDFVLQYDPVLAGASGMIEHVGWFNHDPRCIDGAPVILAAKLPNLSTLMTRLLPKFQSILN
jgi:hypothetical protein